MDVEKYTPAAVQYVHSLYKFFAYGYCYNGMSLRIHLCLSLYVTEPMKINHVSAKNHQVFVCSIIT